MDLFLDMFRQICDDLKTIETSTLMLTGEGEPLLHSHPFNLISISKETGLRVILWTIGTLLDEKKT